MTPELSRPWKADAAFSGEAELDIVADAAERAAVAARLGVSDVAELTCRFRLSIVPGEFGRLSAVGDLRARLTRECVVSLDPFEELVAESFRVRFVPDGTESDDDDPEADDEVPYSGSTIDLGEAAVEQLALAMSPYPRKPGVVSTDAAEDNAASPFAALARLRGAN